MTRCIVFESKDLLPREWKGFADAGPVRVFNPGILRDGNGWILAYRVVGPDSARRIALCRLDAGFKAVPGSQFAFSDFVRFSPGAGYSERTRAWFADPRLYRVGGRLWIYWNSGWHEPMNQQFVQELDGTDLRPTGLPRELALRGERRALEKNWMFFGDDCTRAVHSVSPHRILEASWKTEGRVECAEIHSTPWDNGEFSRKYGELRGGAAPQRVGSDYFSICHAVNGTPGEYRYVAAAYRFAAAPPFAPNAGPRSPLDLPNPLGGERAYPKLNPAVGEVIYPGGAVFEGGEWIVSYGINDERCAVAVIPHEAVLASLRVE
ncbi:MAG: hypothetical protein ABSA05_12320 [Opitutaceae bacterium]|jgi:predicted GH43/DUF377 family glycosyl hydrolase